MTTLIRSFSWSALLASLLLLSAAVRAQSSTSPEQNLTLAMYTSEQHLGLNWEQAAPDSTLTRIDTLAVVRPALLDLRIRRPTSYSVGVVLYWTSTGERPATQFIIERRDEGQADYRAVAVLPGQGAGQELHSYSFVDDGNASPSNYRLRQVCADECINQLSAVQVVPGATPAPPEPKEESMMPGPSLAFD